MNARNIETGQVWSTDEAEAALAFYVVVQCGVLRLDSKSVGGVYIPGVASSFDSINDKDAARAIRSAATSKEVTETLKGFQRYQERKRSKASRTKIPFCLDMAMAAKKDMVDFNFKNVARRIIAHYNCASSHACVSESLSCFESLNTSAR